MGQRAAILSRRVEAIASRAGCVLGWVAAGLVAAGCSTDAMVGALADLCLYPRPGLVMERG